MWSTLLGLALFIALNPVLLGLTLLMVSRRMPVQNLLAFWAGALTVNIPVFLVPLALLHLTPEFASFADGLVAANAESDSSIKPVPLATAVVLLSAAAWVATRNRVRRRELQRVGSSRPPPGRDVNPNEDGAGRMRRPQAAVNRAAKRLQEVHGRLMQAWESGSWRISYVVGMLYLPTLSLVLLIDTMIVTSGAAIGEQIVAAIVFILVFLLVLEFTLLGCILMPDRIERALRPLHEWAGKHIRRILFVALTIAGFWQLVHGLGVL
jgi:hypothetical protein